MNLVCSPLHLCLLRIKSNRIFLWSLNDRNRGTVLTMNLLWFAGPQNDVFLLATKIRHIRNIFCVLYSKEKQTHYRLGQAVRVQNVETPRFQDNRHMKVVRLSALHTGRLYPPQEIFLVLIPVRGWVIPRAMMQPEGFCQWKTPMTPSGIEPANFRLLA